MTNYRNEIKNLVDNANQIQKRMHTLESDLKAVQVDLLKLATHLSTLSDDRLYLRLNGRICRFINSALLKGVNYFDALQDAADTFNVPASNVEVVYNFEKNRNKILERLAKMIMIRRLKKLRYKNRQIAKICGYSEKYLYDLLKNDEKNQLNQPIKPVKKDTKSPEPAKKDPKPVKI